MFLRELTMPVTRISGVGPVMAGRLARLGITSIGGLLRHYPLRWEDRSRPVLFKDWNSGPVSTVAVVLAHSWFGSGRKKTLKIQVEDESARACLVCFNRPFLERQLPPGARCRIFGTFTYRFGELQSTDFEAGPSGGPEEEACPILPVYPLTAELGMGQLRKAVRKALDEFAPALEDELPESIISRDGLLRKPAAQRAIHFPASLEEREKAEKTLRYEELFYLEVMVGKRAMQRKAPSPGKPPPVPGAVPAGSPEQLSPLQGQLLKRLPFPLTPGQEDALRAINRDMDSPFPMARLLQGDVGSGKTLVSFLAVLKAVESKGQAALMAPTELLARQHAENAARYLEPLGIQVALLTGTLKAAERAPLLESLASGETGLAVGTHALFSRDTVYKDLRLVVVDEQHRFGVLQRQAVMAKGTSGGRQPDLLMMSATPIPRTLALTVFGDLDVSEIRDLPPGRKPVKTHLAKESNGEKVYSFVRKQLDAGYQAYFVYPLIEADPNGGTGPDLQGYTLKDAESMAERLAKEVFPGIPLSLLHSKVNEEEKRRIMEAFRRGDTKILVATSVVEVGVDVPNATCMVIEHAERFGLSALHQLRGRTGRGKAQSYCFLVYSDRLTGDGKARLKVMLENSDGFAIAEKDLALRGPGQIAGIEQSGYLALGIADPVRDADALVRARNDAFAMLEADPALEQDENRRTAEVLKRAPPFDGAGV